MPYNLTEVATNVSTDGIVGLLQGTNNVLLFGWLGVMILIGISVIAFFGFLQSTNDAKKSIAASLFLSFGLSLFLRAINIIPDLALFITLVLAGGAFAFLWKE